MAPPPSRCRTCLKDFKSNDIIVKLGTIEAFTMLSVAKKLQMCIPEVSLNEREEKNDALCSKCNYMLDVCCKFRNLCLKTQLKLDAIKKVPSNAKATPTAPTTTQSVAASAPEEPSRAKRKRVESNADTIQIIDDDDDVVETVQPANVSTNVVPAPTTNIVPAPTNIVSAPTTNVVPAPTTNVVPAPANVLPPAVNGLAPVLPAAPFPFAPALPGFGVPQISYLKTDFGYIPIMNANVPLPQSVVHPLTEVLSTAAPAVNGGDKAPAAPATPVAPVTPVAPATPSTPAAQTATVAQKDPIIVIDDEEQPKVKDEPASDGEDNTCPELTAAADEPDDETATASAAEDRNSPLLDILSEDRVDIIERATYSEPVERRMLVDRILKHNVHLSMYTPDQFECYVSIEPLPKKKKKKQVEYICQCNHCGNTFTSRSKLLTHIRMHFNYKPHQCPRCDESFYEPHELKAHELKSHPDVRKSLRKMEAESAKLAEKEKQQPTKYETRNKQVPPLKLQLNSRNSTPAAAATTAAPKDSGPPVLQQMEQPEETKSGKKESLSAIDKTLTRVLTGLLCRFCEVEFKTEKEATKHFDLHCRICFRMVKDHKNHVRLHKMSRDEGGRKMYFCTTCKKNHRRIHFFVHTRVKPFHCYVCDRNYMTFNQFDKHQPECYPPPPVLTNQVDDDFEEEPKKASPAKEKKKVPPLKIKPLPPPPPPPVVSEASKTCTLCRFTYKGEHRCYGRREFRCDACLKSFETVAGFQTHKCVNGGRTSTSCESCNKDFVCEEHGGEKLYKCEICQRQFQHNDFIEHMKVHIM